MSLEFLNEMLLPVIVGICLCIGYMLKHAFPKFPNGYIPITMGVMGVALTIWSEGTINPEVLLIGLISGLASTGLHQTFTRFLNRE